MFDLEKSIAAWRIQMLVAGIKFPVPLKELEIHLREEIERQLHKGIGAQAAFEAAVKQLGHADVLIQELPYKQVRLNIRLINLIHLRVYCFLVAPVVASLVWIFPTSSVRHYVYVNVPAVLLIALYIGGLPFFYRWLFTRIRQGGLMRAVIRFGPRFVAGWGAIFVLSALFVSGHFLGIRIQMGNAAGIIGCAGMIGSSVYASIPATILACANYDHEHAKALAARLAAS